MRGKRLKTAEEILREQLERAIKENEELRKENEKLKAAILGLITRYLGK